MKPVSELSDEELVEEFKSLHHTVRVREVYGLDDLTRFRDLSREIEKRGMEIKESVEVVNQ